MNTPTYEKIDSFYRRQEIADRYWKDKVAKKPMVKRCPDCGEIDEIRGHMTCQYPSNY